MPPWLRMNRFGMASVPCTSRQAPPALTSMMLQAVAGFFTSTNIDPGRPGRSNAMIPSVLRHSGPIAMRHSSPERHESMTTLTPAPPIRCFVI